MGQNENGMQISFHFNNIMDAIIIFFARVPLHFSEKVGSSHVRVRRFIFNVSFFSGYSCHFYFLEHMSHPLRIGRFTFIFLLFLFRKLIEISRHLLHMGQLSDWIFVQKQTHVLPRFTR